MSGSKKIPLITKGTIPAISVAGESIRVRSSWIMLSQKDLLGLKRIAWETYGRPTLIVTGVKARSGLRIPNWVLDELPFPKFIFVGGETLEEKECRVCGGSVTHEDKCTNAIPSLEEIV